ncbi:hypothetical protein Trydic_g9701 [Trypoxylus dichotomus]
MNKILVLTLAFCFICICVESKPLAFDVRCLGLLRTCGERTTQPARAIGAGGSASVVEEDEEDRRIIGTTTCQAGYRQDRQGNCRKIA